MLFDLLNASVRGMNSPSFDFESEELANLARTLLRSTSVGFWIYDLRSERLVCDSVSCEILGREAESLQTLGSWRELVHPEDRDRLAERQIASATAAKSEPIIFRVMRPDGSIRNVRSWAIAANGPDGSMRFVLGMDRDITESQRVAENLEQSQTRFRDLAHNVPGAIFRYILHPDGRDEIEYMSPGCEAIWEIGPEQIQGNPSLLWELIVDEDLADMQTSVMDSGKRMQPWFHRWRIHTLSGTLKWLEGRGTPSRLTNGAILWNSLILDVSPEVRAQEELERRNIQIARSQRIESLGKLVGGVAHDFNNILAVILGNLELLAEEDEANADNDLLQDALAATWRGAHLTRQLLSAGRRSHLKPVRIDLDALLSDSVSMLRRVLPESITIHVTNPPEVWPVLADPDGLQNAVLNLAINARDAMFGKGKLIVEAANIEVTHDHLSARPDEELALGPYVCISVTDTGSGMSPDMVEHAFEAFFSTKNPSEGAGLGLPSVMGFCRQSGGGCRLYSEPGVGTTVRLLLPIDREHKTEDLQEVQDDVLPGASSHILLAEDEDSVAQMVQKQLEKAGFTVTRVSTGDAAWSLIENGAAFDILVTDLVMPGNIQGAELARRVEDRFPGAKILLMSGYPQEAAIVGNAISARHIVLTKPVPRSYLISALKRLLQDH